jgi:hypothetical protein
MHYSSQSSSTNEKGVFVSPSIDKLENILFQFSKIRDGNHKKLEYYVINLRNQEQELFSRLEEYKDQQIKLLQKQRDYEIQNVNDEFDDFSFSVIEMKK